VKNTSYWQTQLTVGSLSRFASFYWRVSVITLNDSTALSDVRSFKTVKSGVEGNGLQPDVFALYQNYPNPFNPITSIAYDIHYFNHITVSIFDIRGRLVEIMKDGRQESGRYTLSWDTNRMSSGVYFIRMTGMGMGKQFVKVKKMILLRRSILC
jgi:hypothetical protein